MCGIAGIVNFDGRPIDRACLSRAVASMGHRGPDDCGTWIDEQDAFAIGVAATRLAILDRSSAGHQPMVSPDGRHTIVFNGLIYNYREIADELRSIGVTLRTSCDTEVVLAACTTWGTDALRRFNGMFAFAYFDRSASRGFIARDRFGIKPLLFATESDGFVFASEMRTLATLGHWSRDIHQFALVQYLRRGFVSHPDTIYESAHRLPPASYATFDQNGLANPQTFYTVPVRRASDPIPDPRESSARIRRLIREGVARRRVADVPIGAFLSGGVDSSIVVSHLAELSSQPVKTFSIGWADESAYDETAFAEQAARAFGTDHTSLRCRASDVLELLPRMLDHLGEPFFDSSILPTALVSQLARQHVTVALSGDGADELFGGYWRYVAHDALRSYERIPRLVRRGLIERLARHVRIGKGSLVQDRVRQLRKLLRCADDNPFARHAAWSRILDPEANDLIESSIPDDLHEHVAAVTCNADPADPLNRILAYDLQYSLADDMLQKVDLASMYHSLEVRVPFLDPDVVACAMSIPSTQKIHAGCTKTVLKNAYRNILPDDIPDRSKKGFEVPIGEFLRHDLRDMFCDLVTRQTIESFNILRYNVVERIYADHCARRAEHADLLFALLSLCWWKSRSDDTIV